MAVCAYGATLNAAAILLFYLLVYRPITPNAPKKIAAVRTLAFYFY
jgi:hypothetical protein